MLAQLQASHQAALANREHMAELQAQKAAAAARMQELDAQRMDAGMDQGSGSKSCQGVCIQDLLTVGALLPWDAMV